MFDGERPDAASTEDGDFGPQGLVVTTVEHDGRWYVSLWYSVAEQLRGTSSLPTRDEAVVPQGGDSPEEIATQFIQAMGDLDLELMLASLHPDEFEALQRYAPIFLDDAQRQLDDAGIQVKISELELRSSTSGDTGAVGIESFALELSGDGDRVAVDWDGECITWELTGSDETSGTGCAADAADSFTPDSDTSPEQGAAALAKGLQDTDIIRVATFEGDWYISLVGSALDGTVNALEQLEPEDLQDAMDSIDEVLGSLDSVFPGDSNNDPWGDDSWIDDEFNADDVFGTGTDDSTGSSSSSDDSTDEYVPQPGDECWSIESGEEAATCFQSYVASGELAPTDVPVQLAYPECGLAEAWWSYYDGMTDEDFIATVTAAHDCFQALVDEGAL
ncbi:MAG: hypothetical protein KDA28_08335, partial [Phycisphaerales bacterium]|nr:hypothetical protein [Phycisphaerales bacterium]